MQSNKELKAKGRLSAAFDRIKSKANRANKGPAYVAHTVRDTLHPKKAGKFADSMAVMIANGFLNTEADQRNFVLSMKQDVLKKKLMSSTALQTTLMNIVLDAEIKLKHPDAKKRIVRVIPREAANQNEILPKELPRKAA